jgi:hypothetical protein
MANIEPPQPLYIFVSKLLLITLWRRICGSFRPIRNPPNTPLRIVAPESAGAAGAFAIRIASAEGHAGGGDGTAARARRGRARGMPLEELGVMLCVWLAWGAQLAQMALQSQREDE